jgi:hypothetical protein
MGLSQESFARAVASGSSESTKGCGRLEVDRYRSTDVVKGTEVKCSVQVTRRV